MTADYLDIASTPSVKQAQEANGSRAMLEKFAGAPAAEGLTEFEIAFIAERDSFYMATVSETGWPYVQHRGGPRGFLKILDAKTLAFADFRGNRQYISVGNLAANDRAALILVDYASQARLKLYVRAELRDLADDADLAAKVSVPGYRARPERAVLLHVEASSWNCPQHITPRFTGTEIEQAVQPMRERLAALEAENRLLRARLTGGGAVESVSEAREEG